MSVQDDLLAAREALASLLRAKLEGASDLSEFYDRRLGALGIEPASSIEKLLDWLDRINRAISSEEGGAEELIWQVG